jgi:hypothetical protein
MQRRDFVKAMVAATVATQGAIAQKTQQPAATPAPVLPPPTPKAAGPVPWNQGLMEVKPLPIAALVPDAVAETVAHFFDERQMKTFRRLNEILMPPWDGYPGALEAGAPEFLEFLIGASPEARQKLYLDGLEHLDSEAQRRFKAGFAELTAAQADEVIRPGLKAWHPEHLPKEPFVAFMCKVQADIRTATVNSQAWSEAAQRKGKPVPDVDLFWYPIDPDLHQEIRAPRRLAGAAN